MSPRAHRRAFWRTCLLALVAVAIAGCQRQRQMFDGPQRPANEVATLQPNPVNARVAFVVTSVDGVKANAREDLVTMLPGERTLALTVTPTTVAQWRTIPAGAFGRLANDLDRRERRFMTLTFDAEAGRVYGLDGARTMDGVIEGAWLVDLADGSIVAHATPADQP